MQNPVQSQEGLNQIATFVYPAILALTAIGTLAMAVIQTLKDMLPLRQLFQKRFVTNWLELRAEQAPVLDTKKKPDPARAQADLVRMATSQDSKALYDLPIEQLCGQANAALQVSLDYPWDHKDLIWCFAFPAEAQDLNVLLHPPTSSLRKKLAEISEEERKFVDTYSAARNRVAHQVQRSIDALQVAAGFRWKFYLQLASIILCVVLSLVGLSEYSATQHMPLKIPAALAMGVLSGFLAPVARDLVAAVQQLRK